MYREVSSRKSLSACCTRRVGATRRLSHCVPWVRGRATGTCPRGCPARARRWNRRGRQRRHPRARTRSYPASRAYMWPRRFRTWPRTSGPPRRHSLNSRPAAALPRADSCIRLPPRAAAPR